MGLIVNELIVAVLYALDFIILILSISKPKFVDILSILISFFYYIYFLFGFILIKLYFIVYLEWLS